MAVLGQDGKTLAMLVALTRVACPSTESTLLQYALHGTAACLERIVRDFHRCKEVEELGGEAQLQAAGVAKLATTRLQSTRF